MAHHNESTDLADQLWELATQAHLRATVARLGLWADRAGGLQLAYNRRIALSRTVSQSDAQARAYRRAARLAQGSAR